MSIRKIILLTVLPLIFTGCDNSTYGPELYEQNKQLKQENMDLAAKIETLRQQNQALQNQLITTTGLPEDVRLENITTAEKIKIAKRTGFYDKDKDGTKETLIVYLQTIDSAGDAIKSPGIVTIELWNLNAPQQNAKILSRQITAEELKSLWVGTLMTSYYRLTLDAPENISPTTQQLTLKVNFIDYITGKNLNEQTTIDPPGKL
jgi:hypothetical protein